MVLTAPPPEVTARVVVVAAGNANAVALPANSVKTNAVTESNLSKPGKSLFQLVARADKAGRDPENNADSPDEQLRLGNCAQSNEVQTRLQY
jgi:hypothetical protein